MRRSKSCKGCFCNGREISRRFLFLLGVSAFDRWKLRIDLILQSIMSATYNDIVHSTEMPWHHFRGRWLSIYSQLCCTAQKLCYFCMSRFYKNVLLGDFNNLIIKRHSLVYWMKYFVLLLCAENIFRVCGS